MHIQNICFYFALSEIETDIKILSVKTQKPHINSSILLILRLFNFNNMNELVKVSSKNGQQVVSARELYQFLSVDNGSHFADWSLRNINEVFVENVDYQTLRYVSENGGRPGIDYAITIECAKEISMMSRCDKGKQARLYFIECEQKVKSQLPATYLDALKALVASEEAKQLAENKVIELQPKADVYDSIADASNLLDMNQAAKSIGIGRNKLFKRLRDMKILMSNNNPFQMYISAGYFEVKVRPTIIDGNVVDYTQTFVTGKGLTWLSDKIK